MGHDLQRYTLPDGRVYTNGDDLYLPSVSTVLDERPEPENLKKWKDNHDGTNSKKHWRDILKYKQNRGTLIHYNLLNEFADEDIYSNEDEGQSEQELKLNGDWKRYQEDLAYAEDAWNTIKRIRGITDESVLNVECFVRNTGVGYAGQFDGLYIDKQSNVVLTDIKTSNKEQAPYKKHKLQLTAYKNALRLDVDILEVIIIHPDSRQWKISHNTDWNEDIPELWNEFRELRESMGDVEQEMKEIASEGVDDG